MPKSTTFHKGSCTFTYRVAAVIVDQGRVLLHRSARDDFWSLPGGKVELGEEAEQALRREVQEELHCAVEIERLLWLVENFFEYGGEKYHELGLYFLASLPQDHPHLSESEFQSVEAQAGADPLPLYFRWFEEQRDQLAAVDIRPAFLRDGLVHLPNQITNLQIRCVNL